MEINKSTNLFANVNIKDGNIEKIVANFSANIGDNQMNHNISVSIINKELIELNEENKAAYKEQYDQFIQAVNNYLL